MTANSYTLKLESCQEKSERRLAWFGWIDKHFSNADWFGTLTFQDYKSTYNAKRYFWKWLRQVNHKRWGNKLQRAGASVSWVLGEEKQERGALHYHCLLKNVTALMRNEFGKIWWDITGGYGKILPSSGTTAIAYITKYILKDGIIDLDICDNITGQRLTPDDLVGTEAERGRQGVLTGFYLPLEAK